MADLSIVSWRGGMNNTDPSIAIPDDQCVLAQNVEFVESMLGERRKGTTAITLPAFLSGQSRVTFLHRHLPTSDETAAQLWALGVTGTSTAALGYKTTTWTQVTISDTPTLTGFGQYRWRGVTLHGKLHLAYPSNQDRLHVWDGTTLRRSGFATPAAPTTAETGSAGSFAGTRYYRVRYLEKAGSVIRRRSEPSAAATFAPSGTKTGAVITKPAALNEGETHWELEASEDDATYYVLADTAVGTATVTDTTDYSTGYADGDLSADVGDYTPIWSARYLAVDGDRLLWAGSFADDALASRVGWSPVFNADGTGNDERYEADTDPTLDLDTYEHGSVTGLTVSPVLGSIWVFKHRAIYKLTRTGQRSAAYEADKFTDTFGAIHGSVVTGIDESGQPCVYFIDQEQGPCRIGVGGIRRCGEDLRRTWSGLNVDASKVAAMGLFYPKKKQLIWGIATGTGASPNTSLVLHVDKARVFADGARKGYALWTGTRAEALAACLYADNIEDNTARSLRLVPFIGVEGQGLLHQCDTGDTDNDVAYEAELRSKPYLMGSLLNQFEIRSAALLATATTNAAVSVRCLRDYGREETTIVQDVGLSPEDTETDVIRALDQLVGAEMRVGQIAIADVAAPQAQWRIQRLDLLGTAGQQG